MRTDVLTSHGFTWEAPGSIPSLGTVVVNSIIVSLLRTLEVDNLEASHCRFFPGPQQFRVQNLLRHRCFLTIFSS
jgi:hypothetical protein